MPDFTIKGSPGAIEAKGAVLVSRGRDFVTVGDGLSSLSTSGWTGRAADRFREKFEVDPPRWRDAGNGFVRAGNALTGYAGTLRWAQGEASWCEGEWARGEEVTRAARAAYDADVRAAKREKALHEAENGPGTFTLTIVPFADPGESIRAEARRRFEAAKGTLDSAAHEAAAGVRAGTSAAPASRNWLESGLAFVGGVIVGAGAALWDLGKLGWSLSPMGQVYELSKLATGELTVEEFAAKQQLTLETAQGLWTALTTDPVGFGLTMGKALLDWDTWKDDPARALGHLVPDAIAAVFTAGTGAVATRGASAAGAVSRHADDIVEGAVDAGRAVNRIEDLTNLRRLDDFGGWHHIDAGDARHVDLDTVPEWAQESGRLRPSDPGYDLYPRDYDRYGGLSQQQFYDRYWDGDAGGWRYPADDGFDGPRLPNSLKPGDEVDRFSDIPGKYTAPADTPFDQRSLPPSNVGSEYTRYKVLKELPPDVVEGVVAPAFGQPGGGVQHFFPKGIDWYEANKYLEVLK